MKLPELAIEKRTVTYFIGVLLVVGGVGSFFTLGWLEDPVFTVKTAAVVTSYPGASAEEVELEVTDRLEIALQELPQLDELFRLDNDPIRGHRHQRTEVPRARSIAMIAERVGALGVDQRDIGGQGFLDETAPPFGSTAP